MRLHHHQWHYVVLGAILVAEHTLDFTTNQQRRRKHACSFEQHVRVVVLPVDALHCVVAVVSALGLTPPNSSNGGGGTRRTAQPACPAQHTACRGHPAQPRRDAPPCSARPDQLLLGASILPHSVRAAEPTRQRPPSTRAMSDRQFRPLGGTASCNQTPTRHQPLVGGRRR